MKTNDESRDATAADLVVCAADVVIDEKPQRASEASYRRGIHHGLALAGGLGDIRLLAERIDLCHGCTQRFIEFLRTRPGEAVV
jgi:hypothetical protein